MRRLLWLLAGVVGFVACVLAAAWVVPPLLDWNRFRAEIAVLASETLGRTVRIDGPVALALLPQPMLTAANVAVDEGQGWGVTATELRLRVALGPLLAGRVDARELVLHGVDMRLPWPLSPDALVWHAPSWLSSLSAQIEDGRLEIGNLSFTGVQATLATAADTGTYLASGTAQASGRDWRFSARLTRPGGDGSAGIDLALDGQGKVKGLGMALSGQIAGDGTMAGRITANGPDLSQLLPAPAVPFKAEGRISIASGLAAADELAVELGGSPARGAVALRIAPAPRLDLALTASRLDLDAWLAALLRGGSGAAVSGLPTGIDLSAEAAPLAGGTVRGLRGAFDLGSGVMEVRELRASLPGEAGLRVAGRMTLPQPDAKPAVPGRFDGYVALTAPDLRTTLRWVQGAGLAVVGRLPEGVMRRAELAGHVVVDPGQVALDGLSGTLDGANIGGTASLRLGPHPVIGAGLTVDRLELDPWLPEVLPGPAALASRLTLDVNLRLEAKQALLRGETIAPLSLDLGTEGGRLSLRKLDMTVDGVHTAASGTLSAGGQITEGRLEVQAQQATPLERWIPPGFEFLTDPRTAALWQAPLTLQVQGSGLPVALALKVAADFGDLRIDLQPTLDTATGNWAGSVTLRHPGAARLLRSLGLNDAAAWFGDGSLALVAQLTAAGPRIAGNNFDLTVGALHAKGSLAVDRSGPVPQVSGKVAAETLPLPLPPPRSTAPLPLGALEGWQASLQVAADHVLIGTQPPLDQASATVTLAGSLLRIEGFAAKLGGGALSGTLSMNVGAEPPVLAVDAKLAGASIGGPLSGVALDLTAGGLDGTLSLSASGHSPAALLATLTGQVQGSVLGGTLAGVDLARASGGLSEKNVTAALGGGTTAFERLDVAAEIDRGVVRLSEAKLASPAGSMTATGSLDLSGATADLRLALRPAVPDPPEIGVLLSGKLDALQRTPQLADVVRWRAEHPAQH